MRLKELQAMMSAALVSREGTAPNPFESAGGDAKAFAGLIEYADPGLTPTERLSIYRNNSRAVRAAALEESFPAIRSLVGADYFEAAARRYAAETPARSSDLNQYGAGFPEFLGRLPGLTGQAPYIVDVARFERLFCEVRHSPPDTNERSAMRLLESPYPLDRIIAACFDDDSEEIELPEIDGESERFRFLLYREGGQVRSRAVDRGLFERLEQLQTGAASGGP